MKTLARLLYVEADEEITDLVDRLRDLDSEDAVTFVLPERARSLQSPMSFRLLKRYADSYGKHVNVISSDPRLQSLSLESGFSAFPNLAAYDRGAELHRADVGEPFTMEEPPIAAAPAPARETPVVSPAPRRPAEPAPKLRGAAQKRPPLLYAALAAGALVALLAGVLLLPTTTVSMSVAGTPLKTDLQLVGAPGTPAGSPDHFATQAISVSRSQTALGTATGEKQVAAVAASGDVVFNLICISFFVGCEAKLAQGVVVRTSSGKRYATQRAVRLAGFSDSATVPVIALNPGVDGNTDANSINTIERNDKPDELKVHNPQAFTNGSDPRTATVIQKRDIDAAKNALQDTVNPKVQEDVNSKANGQHVIPIQPEVTFSDVKEGAEVPSFSITVTVKAAAVAFDDAVVRKMLKDALQRKVPQGQQLTSDRVKTAYDIDTAAADGNVRLKGHSEGFTIPQFSQPGLRSYVKGRTPSDARARLQSVPQVVDVVIRQDPIPLPWLPFFSSRINIRILEASGSAGT